MDVFHLCSLAFYSAIGEGVHCARCNVINGYSGVLSWSENRKAPWLLRYRSFFTCLCYVLLVSFIPMFLLCTVKRDEA